MPSTFTNAFFACALSASALLGQDARTRIVFVGDSITEGTVQRPTYRQPLWTLLHDAGYCFDFVGARRGVIGGRAPAHPTYDLDHYGFSGGSTLEVCFQLFHPLPQFEADVAVVQLGTNDVIKGTVFYQMTTQQIASVADQFLRGIVSVLRSPQYDPDMQIVLAKIPPLPAVLVPTSALSLPAGTGTIYGLDQGILAVNQAIDGLANLPGVRIVDLHTGFDVQAQLADQVHPNASGEQFIADRIYASLAQILPAPNPNSPCYSEYGTAAGTGRPTMQPTAATQAPALGSMFQLDIANMPSSAPIVGVIGLTPAAISLAAIDEFLFVDPAGYTDARMIGVATGLGDFSWSLQVPAVQDLAGLDVYVQALAFANDSIAAVTNGGILRLGN
jgi:lysophospholipase L1-like esterase